MFYMKILLGMISAVDSLRDRMERLVRQTQRMRLEMKENPTLHLRPCRECGITETRFGICAACEEQQNGHPT